MLPLLFIIGITAIKDGVEDYRRSRLDDEVNNSAATKLEGWRNANQPRDPRGWAERALGLNKPGEVTRGVRRLREREASEGRDIVLARPPRADGGSMSMSSDPDAARTSDGRLEDIQSIDEHEHSYPPGPGLLTSLSAASSLGAKTAGGDSSTHLVASPPASYDPAADAAAQADKPGGGSVIDYSKRGAGTARWERTLWKKLEVGDVVLLRGDEQVPADIVVLATSDADGLCYLETKNLDGETNLKPRRACRSTGALGSEADVERAAFALDSEPAHQNLYVYHGVLRYTEPRTGAAHNDAVTIDELLLRGCTLRNTDWVIGLVVFTGADTKIMLNGGATPSKRSKIEKETNFNVVMNLVILVGMCAITAVGSGILDGKQDTSAKFFEVGSDASNSAALNGIVTFVCVQLSPSPEAPSDARAGLASSCSRTSSRSRSTSRSRS
jgi:phospholipid-translocating ATPase